MGPRYVINKGIQYDVTAVGKMFIPNEEYTAAIYNPKDSSVKIIATATCYEVEGKNTIAFSFSAQETNYLKEGYATIEIYDNNHYRMVYRDNFSFIRKNSLPIEGESDPVPLQTLVLVAPAEEGSESEESQVTVADTSGLYVVLNTGRAIKLHIIVDYNSELDQNEYSLEADWDLRPHKRLLFPNGIGQAVHSKSNNGESLTSVKAMRIKVESIDTATADTPVEIDIFG